MPQDEPRPRRRRRAVGPVGAVASGELVVEVVEPDPDRVEPDAAHDARLLADVPPHHGG